MTLPEDLPGETPTPGVGFGARAVAAAAFAGGAPAMGEWSIPPLKAVTPPTDALRQSYQQNGRALPVPELLQPTLDPALPAFEPAHDASRLRGDYRGGASDVLASLSKRWVAGFREHYPEVNLIVDPPYAGSLGAAELIKGHLDCVFVSRELRPADIQGFRAAFAYAPLSVPISGGSYRHFGFLDALGLVVNLTNPIQQLSFDQLDAVLSTTRHRGGAPITTWGQLGLTGHWADQPIRIYGVKPWNGFEEFIRQRVLNHDGRRGEWRPGEATPTTPADPHVHWDSTVFQIAREVARDPLALGYTGLAYVDEPVKLLALSAHAGDPVHPATYEEVALASYPLSRMTYLNLNKRPGTPLDPVLAELARFILSRQGQQVVREQGVFLPLRTPQATTSTLLLNAAP
jgi:phosphate transport system substrate-binding protein